MNFLNTLIFNILNSKVKFDFDFVERIIIRRRGGFRGFLEAFFKTEFNRKSLFIASKNENSHKIPETRKNYKIKIPIKFNSIYYLFYVEMLQFKSRWKIEKSDSKLSF